MSLFPQLLIRRRRERMPPQRRFSDIRRVRSNERDSGSDGKWYFAASGVTDCQIMASGVFTSDQPYVFYSRRAIASFRGKLLNLRNMCAPGRRIDEISVIPYGETRPISLSFENLEKEFRERLPFKKKKVYFVCLVTGERKEDCEMEEL